MQDFSDEKLVGLYLGGDEKALEFLVSRYLRVIYTYVFRNIGDAKAAEDVTQEVFVKAWKNLKKFKPEKSFKTWIFSIAKNTSIDFLRKKKTIPFSEFENKFGENVLTERLADTEPRADEMAQRGEELKALEMAQDQLSPKYKEVLTLRYRDYFSFKEIAQRLGQSVDTIKSQHRRALITLRKVLDKLYL
jgi:RNA polymerase sigma-70 factor (ECF subfamily)